MAGTNTLITTTEILDEMLLQVNNNRVFSKVVHTDYSKEFKKVGNSVSIRKPLRMNVTDGETMVLQDLNEQSVSVLMDKRKHVALSYTQTDRTLKMKDFSERYVKPCAEAIAQEIDYQLCLLAQDVPAAAGTAGTSPSTFAALAAAAQKMDEAAVPSMGRNLILNPAARWALADGLKGVFQPTIVENVMRSATFGRMAEFDIFASQNIQKHTNGIGTGTQLVNGASQTGSSLVTDGWTNSTTGILKKGDVFTIAGVYAVNPLWPFASTGALRQFVVTTDADSGATTGPATVSIYPPITTPITATSSPAYPAYPASTQANAIPTCDSTPADNAAITVVASHAMNIAFNKNAFALVTAPLEPLEGVKSEVLEAEGVAITVTTAADVVNFKTVMRFDVLFGVKTIYPEMACRLLG